MLRVTEKLHRQCGKFSYMLRQVSPNVSILFTTVPVKTKKLTLVHYCQLTHGLYSDFTTFLLVFSIVLGSHLGATMHLIPCLEMNTCQDYRSWES